MDREEMERAFFTEDNIVQVGEMYHLLSHQLGLMSVGFVTHRKIKQFLEYASLSPEIVSILKERYQTYVKGAAA